ncbi:T9SS type A sorting domain-containing protein [Peijinzhouia sedimentorum]
MKKIFTPYRNFFLIAFSFLLLLGFNYSAISQTATLPAGAGTGVDPYQIATLENLYWIAATDTEVASPNRVTRWAAHYIQTANIDATSTSGWFSGEGWSPIGNGTTRFTGTYNGGDFTISGLYMNRPTAIAQGLFGYLEAATIQNLGLLDVNFTAKNNIGALVGFMSNSGSIMRCYSTGTVNAETDAAGLIAQLDGSVSTITVSESFSTADVTSSLSVGSGLLGWAQNVAVSNSYALGDVTVTNTGAGGLIARSTGSTITNSFAAGGVSASSSAGGLVAFTDSSPASTFTNSFWDTETSGLGASAGGTGKTTAEMKSLATFTTDITPDDWDFTASTGVWQIQESSGGFISYPYLQNISYDVPEATPEVNPIPGLLAFFSLSSSLPAANASVIAAGDNIELTFTTPPSLATFTASNAVIRGQQSGTIAGTWAVSGNNATFNPSSDLTAGEVIHVELGTGVGGTNGQFLLSPENFSFTVASASPLSGDTWISASAAEANQWLSVTYGNGRFVAVAQTGTNRVMYSDDGVNWTAASSPEANSWISVTYGNGRFVAVSVDGSNRVMYSDDGISWSAAFAAEANNWFSVTYGNGRFVAVSSNGTNRVMYSNDGITWTAAAAAQAIFWRSVTYGNGRFVAVARNGTNRVMYSDDGISWTTAFPAEDNNWNSVTYGKGRFVAVAEIGTNRVMYSNDGVNWTAASAAETNNWQSVTYGNGRFVAVTNTGTNRVMYSNDGISWTAAPAAEANNWFGVTYGKGRFVAVAADGTNSVMVTLSTFIWTGTTDTDTDEGSNWIGGTIPPAGSDISIPTGLSNYPVFSSDFQAGDLEIQSGATFTMAPGFTLSFAAGKGASGDGKIILKSDATGDASIGDLTGAGSITVDVEQERFVAGNNRAFRFLSHPFSDPLPLSVIGSIVDITGIGGSANGFTTTNTNAPSAFRFDPTQADDDSEEDAGWIAFTNTSQTIAPVEGIRMLIRGSKGQSGIFDDGAYTPANVTMAWEGTVNTGNVVKALSSATIGGEISDWNLVGNPYPSSINMRNITNAGASNFISVWTPRAGDASGELIPGAGRGGAYVTRLLTDAGFDPIVLPSGSAFFIQADPTDTGTPGTITFTESMKISGEAPFETVLRTEEYTSKYGPNSIGISLTRGAQFYDQVVVYFQETAPVYDKLTDGIKLANPVVNFFTVSADNFALSNDARAYAEAEGSNRIPLHINSPATTFKLSLPDFDLEEGRTIQLYDRFTEEYITLQKGTTYGFEVTDDPSSKGHRFDLVMGIEVITSIHPSNHRFQAYLLPNPAQEQVRISIQKPDNVGETTVKIVSMTGVEVSNEKLITDTSELDINLSQLSKGIYLVEITHGTERIVKRLIVN